MRSHRPRPVFRGALAAPTFVVASIVTAAVVLGGCAGSDSSSAPSPTTAASTGATQSAAATSAAATTPSSSPTPVAPAASATPRPSEEIAFFKFSDSTHFGIQLIRADGSASAALVNGWSPAWSPDGRQLAFISEAGGGSLYITGRDGSSAVAVKGLVPNGIEAWSPDSQSLLFSARNSCAANDASLYLVGRDGATPKRLTETPAFTGAWSPDGKKIAFATLTNEGTKLTGEIWTMNADGSGKVRIVSGGTGKNNVAASPSWSPDGRLIAFSTTFRPGIGAGDDPNGEIWTVAPDGSGLRKVASGWRFAWSPDGKRLAFEAGPAFPPAERGIYIAAPDGTGLTRLTKGGDTDYAPSWSPDGKRIVYQAGSDVLRMPRIMVMQADGTQPANIAAGSEPIWLPAAASATSGAADSAIAVLPPVVSNPIANRRC